MGSVNAWTRGSYAAPHRHLQVPKPESFIVLRGELALFLFDDLGNKFGPLNGRFAIAPADVEAFVGVALEREAEKVSFLADPDGCDLGFGVAVG